MIHKHPPNIYPFNTSYFSLYLFNYHIAYLIILLLFFHISLSHSSGRHSLFFQNKNNYGILTPHFSHLSHFFFSISPTFDHMITSFAFSLFLLEVHHKGGVKFHFPNKNRKKLFFSSVLSPCIFPFFIRQI